MVSQDFDTFDIFFAPRMVSKILKHLTYGDCVPERIHKISMKTIFYLSSAVFAEKNILQIACVGFKEVDSQF